MICRELIEKLNILCPPEYAMSWDNSGLIAGRIDREIKTVYIALDATDAVIDAASAAGADLLLTHHPLVFSSLKKINDSDFTGQRLLTLIENKIGCFAMHTNFDVAVMADLASDMLGLVNTQPLEKTGDTPDGEIGIGKTGNLESPITLKDCAGEIKKIFDVKSVTVFGPLDKLISRVAICPGSGKSTIGDAVNSGADVLITGDIGHHEGLDAMACNLAIIDAGHQGIEKIFIHYMEAYFKAHFPDIHVVTENSCSPFTVM